MAEHVGDKFPALIVNTAPFGFFVELVDLFVEGLVPLENLPGGRWRYNETSRKITEPRTRRQFSIGDRVRVQLDRVDAIERKLSFSVVLPNARKLRRE